MTGGGLAQVPNPSALFLANRDQPAPGSAVFAGIEGTRPVLTEIQALVAPSTLASPRRTVVGLDSGRVSTILAVLEARCGIPFAGLDVFLNVAGGLRVSEPAADLAVAGALLSAREDVAIPPDMVLFGEISLSGALRPVGQTENRLKEASKLGFSQATVPSHSKFEGAAGLTVRQMPDLTAFVGEMFGAG
jgi:DNA repair protein RadA/Sms